MNGDDDLIARTKAEHEWEWNGNEIVCQACGIPAPCSVPAIVEDIFGGTDE